MNRNHNVEDYPQNTSDIRELSPSATTVPDPIVGFCNSLMKMSLKQLK